MGQGHGSRSNEDPKQRQVGSRQCQVSSFWLAVWCLVIFHVVLFAAIITTVMTLAAFAVMNYMKLPVTYLYTHLLQFIASSIVFSLVLSVLLYIKSRNAPQSARSVEGNTGMLVFQYVMKSMPTLHESAAWLDILRVSKMIKNLIPIRWVL